MVDRKNSTVVTFDPELVKKNFPKVKTFRLFFLFQAPEKIFQLKGQMSSLRRSRIDKNIGIVGDPEIN